PDVVAESLDDASEVMRQAALELIAAEPEVLSQDITEKLRALMDSGAPKSAALAAQAYASVAGEDAFEELDAVLRAKDQPETVRLGALDGIRMIGGAAAILALASVLDDEARQLRLRAMAALARLAASDAWPNSAGDVLLAALGGELIEAPETDEASQQQEPPKAQPSEQSAGARSEPGAGSDVSDDESDAENQAPVSTLDAILGAESPAADVLRRRSETTGLTPTDLDYLARAQERSMRKRVVSVLPAVAPHQDVRRLAARMLGDIPELDVFRALVAGLEDRDDEVAGHAADSLARIAPRLGDVDAADTDALVHAITTTPERSRKLSLIRALGHLGRADCAGALGRYLKDKDRFIRLEAARALGHLAAPAPGLDARLKDSDPGVRMAAAEAIATIEGQNAFDRLFDLAFAFDGEHRRGAGRLLRQVNVAAASEGFNSILRDQARMRAWPSAIEALEELHRPVEGADI
ncbi:MAG: HEAT repeat domain-containing protein, partial [Methyloligellaceae bacterium]